MNEAVTLRQLRKTYGAVVAVDGLDLDVRQGEFFGLLGPNGAGKTTSMEVLEGLLEPTSGEVRVFGQTWKSDRAALIGRVGVALQETQLSDRLTVRETLRLFRSFYKTGADVDSLLEELQLVEKRDAWVKRLSGGQRQRLAVACGLVGNPDLLFLDEPTTGLDPQSRRALWDILLRLKSRGTTLLLTTHYMDEAERLCDRVAIVDHGKVIALGTPRELILGLGGEHLIELGCAPVLGAEVFAGMGEISAARLQGDRVLLSARDPAHSLPAILATVAAHGAQLLELSVRHATLEDVFVKLTGRQLRDE
jgi:ABC-2 type transport system ATP-binding protein